jgi:DNA replication ATP-dependent helicase Dna2
VIKKKLTKLDGIRRVVDEFLQRRDTTHLLFTCKMSQDEMRNELEPFTEKIHEFMRQYIVGDSELDTNSFVGRITEVRDIEETVWCPRLGLKGKIDVSVTVNTGKCMPLEIKTGKASFSIEHKGQLILYQMMLQDLGKEVDSGLLLYIKEGIMKEVGASAAEKLGLIQMRNRLAFYLKTGRNYVELPEPINHRSACSRCEYNTVCCTFLGDAKLPAGHNLKEVQGKVTAHLTTQHVDYFLQWCEIITEEHNEAQRSVKLCHIWTKTPEARETKGSALINLKVHEVVIEGDEFVHNFSVDSDVIKGAEGFDSGEYLIVSTDMRCSVAAGRVIAVEPSMISLALPRDLTKQYGDSKFHLDRYESQSQAVFNYSNIGALLDEKAAKLRKIIIEKEPAVFHKTLT